jgi:hypothetical protein
MVDRAADELAHWRAGPRRFLGQELKALVVDKHL